MKKMDGSLFGKGLDAVRPPQVVRNFNDQPILEARLALTPETLNEAFELRHAGYLSYGYIDAKEDGLFSDEYDGRDTCRTVVLYKDGVPAAAVRVCLFDPFGGTPGADSIPATAIFHDEITALLGRVGQQNRPPRAVEVTRLARHPDHAEDRSLVYALFRTVGYLILYYDADLVVTAVRAHHMPFYRRLGLQKMEEPRAYPNLKFDTGLMACFRNKFDDVQAQVPLFRGITRNDRFYRPFISGQTMLINPAEQTARAPRAANWPAHRASGITLAA
jgi:hypothetical protein